MLRSFTSKISFIKAHLLNQMSELSPRRPLCVTLLFHFSRSLTFFCLGITQFPCLLHNTMSLFPQELLEAIIDDLYDDLPTLRACGMVSRAFLHSTRTHIFANIRLTPKSGLPNPATVGSYPNCLNPCQKFHALLVNSPYISSYVQRLIIIDGSLFPSHPSADITGTAPSGSPWVLDEPSLPYVIRYLTRLRSVSLIFQEGPLRNWSAMSKALTDSLLSTLRLPNLESVELQRIGFDCPDQLFHLFNGAHALKNISLTSIRTSSAVFSAWEHAESKTIQQGGVLPQIEGLTVDTLDRSHFPLIQSIVTCHTALDLSSLRTIAIPNASISELRSIINLLQSVRGSLEHLTLPVSLCLRKYRSKIHFSYTHLCSSIWSQAIRPWYRHESL